MPYIKPETREHIEEEIKALADKIHAVTSTSGALDGTLNYTVCRLMALLYPEESYYNYNRQIGALECVKMELYRRRVGPYEHTKIEENGDVEGWSAPDWEEGDSNDG